ncbi:hypothetical protein QCA50_003286 [Cerrena zonata]|uniref:RNA-dependent RNA polymerase n=1 Tax=Cerrena zonata TaxID=2478898 RepID=A0AAW0GVX7_9APHY
MMQRQPAGNPLFQRVDIRCIQFGWECRDSVFSVEWERSRDGAVLGYIEYRDTERGFRIFMDDFNRTHIAVIHATKITWVGSNADDTELSAFFSLVQPPVFESDELRSSRGGLGDFTAMMAALNIRTPLQKRRRHPSFHPSQATTAPYTSLAIRVICNTRNDLGILRFLCRQAHVRVSSWVYPAEHRRLFSEEVQSHFTEWLLTLSWKIAFQLESIVRGLLADPGELLSCRNEVDRMRLDRGEPHVLEFLQYFANQLQSWHYIAGEDEGRPPIVSIDELFTRCTNQFVPSRKPPRPVGDEPTNLFECLHVIVTPSRLRLEGPYPERSNRIMRTYPNNHDSFIRVKFVEETNLPIRFDRDVDGRGFIRNRFGDILHNGLLLSGRLFQFLGYSQSALKEHSVWLVKPFNTPEGVSVTAASIIASLGDFTNPDPQLKRCPARYGARMSQAFTATEASTSVEAEEIFIEEDILGPSGEYNFTDGVGTMSRDMAIDIWQRILLGGHKAGPNATYPRAYQIRFQGAKGMLSLDHRLAGTVVVLRPSMIKFQAPDTNIIEIAQAFSRPSPFFLNRPLIMILEQLGVPYENFKALQDEAIQEANTSIQTLGRSARFLEAHGFGASFKLVSTMLSLEKLGIHDLMDDAFYRCMMDFAVIDILRDLKHRARIPVKDAWIVVGVADVHGYLEEGEVFIYVISGDDEPPVYFEGPTLITRSPVIHPGDVQVAHAIGRPPPGSPFARETLRNCVVFSTKGTRPLSSYLGGGDLDGDEYYVTMRPDLLPTLLSQPAAYTPAQRHVLNRDSTMDDIADFIVEYIISDNLGLIATQWLMLADRDGIFTPDCLRLSQLHSDAVDYPKTGRPVFIQVKRFDSQPDWRAPETSASRDRTQYYESTRAIGRLSRAIDLPDQPVHDAELDQRRRLQLGQFVDLEDVIAGIYATTISESDGPLVFAVYTRVKEIIAHAADQPDVDIIFELWDLLQQYTSQIQSICADHTLSHARNALLTEEEVTVGTIVAKSSQPRRRKEIMTKMRERTAALALEVGLRIEGDEEPSPRESLERAWVAFRIANLEQDAFGTRSFGWIALGETFSAIKKIEEMGT